LPIDISSIIRRRLSPNNPNALNRIIAKMIAFIVMTLTFIEIISSESNLKLLLLRQRY
jgi:hypothetical protein